MAHNFSAEKVDMGIAMKYHLEASLSPFDELTRLAPEFEKYKLAKTIMREINFQMSRYCSPYFWLKHLTCTENDLQTLELSKFLTDLSMLEYRFLPMTSRHVAAICTYTARRIQGKCWVSHFTPPSLVSFC
jgi:hypothetical protein